MKTREKWIKNGRIVREFESTRYFSNDNNALYARDQTRKLKKRDLKKNKIFKPKNHNLVNIIKNPHFIINVPKNIPLSEQLIFYFKLGFISSSELNDLLSTH